MNKLNPAAGRPYYRDEISQDERMFWKGFNRRKHAHFLTAKDEQRQAFWDECAKPEPATKPITGRVLEVVR